jgi:NADPH-dependent 2,4-dienoyl-CoA reductase/sulfur reductase-like enzyme
MTISPSERGPVWDVAIVGAGPAGLAAAVSAADQGARVAVVDAESAVGGQFWRHPAPRHEPNRVRDTEVAPFHHGLDHYWRLRDRLAQHVATGRAEHLSRHEVWAVQRVGPTVAGSVPDPAGPARSAVGSERGAAGASSSTFFDVLAIDAATPLRPESTVRARTLVLAPGAFDLQVPFPGWDLPGVLTAGGAQSLIKGHGVLAGKRVVVAGTGPFLLSVGAGLVRRGATVPAIVEAASLASWLRRPGGLLSAGSKLAEGAAYANTLTRQGVSILTRWSVLRADGRGKVDSVTVAPIGSAGELDPDRARRIPVDVLAVGWGFMPQLELPLSLGCAVRTDASGLPVAVVDADQRSTVPGVYLAGEVCGVGGAALALVEGEIAGLAAARAVGAPGAAGAAQVARAVSRAGRPETAYMHGDLAMTRQRIRLVRRREMLRTFADALAEVYPIPGCWLGALTDDTVVCRCEEVTAGAIREVARDHRATDARTVKLLARPGMGHCQGRICSYAAECVAAHELGTPAAHRPATRPVAAPLSLGTLAAGASAIIPPTAIAPHEDLSPQE